MIFKNFYLNTVFRLGLIFFTGFLALLIFQLLSGEYIFTLLGIGLILGIQIFLLFKFINRFNQDLTRFLSAVKNEDLMQVFQEAQENKYFRELYQLMNDLNEKIVAAKAEGQKQSLLLNSLVNNIGIGLIIYFDSGEIKMINHAAKEILQVASLNHTNRLKNIEADLYDQIINLQPGKPVVVRFIHHNQVQNEHGIIQQLLLKKDVTKIEGKTLNTVSIQNIVNEMERKELDSWQKLIRVLTHEIMNSISPILSLTKSITRNFREENKNQPISPADITDNVVEKTLSGLLTISDTGEGLIDFVTKYRSLTRLPEPQLASFRIETLFNKVRVLMQEEKNKEHISLTTVIAQDGLELVADINQLEKVLINLVKNSVEALTQKDSGNIKLEAMKKQDIILLQVEDDGPGISPDIIDDIFVPFFTTKTKGSGIGLSISRQIMLKHEGTLFVHSVPGKKTVFTLKF